MKLHYHHATDDRLTACGREHNSDRADQLVMVAADTTLSPDADCICRLCILARRRDEAQRAS